MKRGIAISVCIVIVLSVSAFRSPRAQWRRNGYPVCGDEGSQHAPDIVADEKGYATIVWLNGQARFSDTQVCGQRLDPDGYPVWTPNGVSICAEPGYKLFVSVAADHNDGAVVVWLDGRGPQYCVYAQGIDCAGSVRWNPKGVPISATPHKKGEPKAVPVASGGAIVIWAEARGVYWDIFAQRIDKNGVSLWASDGVCVFAGVNVISDLWSAVSDGLDGAVVVFQKRNWAPDQYDIHAQRIDSNGVCLWGGEGAVVCAAPGEQWRPHAALLDDGTIAAVWQSLRLPARDLCAQRIDADGRALWDPNGVSIRVAINDATQARIASGGGSEAIIAWTDKRNGNSDIFVQKVNCDGKLLWAPEGAALCTEPARQSLAGLISTSDGGAIAAWSDERFETKSIFAQKVSAEGAALWEMDGTAVCSTEETAPNSCAAARMAGDARGGAIIAWEDCRTSMKDSVVLTDIYAMRATDAAALLTRVDPLDSPLRLRQNYPNPFNPATEITFELEEPASISLGIYDASGRFLRRLAEGRRPAGAHAERWDGLDMSGRAVASGIYFCRLEAGPFTETKKMVLLR